MASKSHSNNFFQGMLKWQMSSLSICSAHPQLTCASSRGGTVLPSPAYQSLPPSPGTMCTTLGRSHETTPHSVSSMNGFENQVSLIHTILLILHFLVWVLQAETRVQNIWSFSVLEGLRASSLEAPGLRDTSLDTLSTQTPRGQELLRHFFKSGKSNDGCVFLHRS